MMCKLPVMSQQRMLEQSRPLLIPFAYHSRFYTQKKSVINFKGNLRSYFAHIN
ncbi:hypothetical protein HanPSC8_Chr14g0626451 [Helianthus annuus]|nr:hypothetical protein HanPSC8_Chr14g0626451 [Helianthus annuus]